MKTQTEEQAAHTPGPWRIRTGWSGGIKVIEPAGSPLSTTQLAQVTASNPDVELANARLIAAAPDLLAALELMIADTLVGIGSISAAAKHRASAAIAQATKGQP